MILLISTADKTCYFALAQDGVISVTHSWLAERRLAKELLGQIKDFLSDNDQSFESLSGIAVFRGPGSFTGLRIGITVVNTLADSLSIPIVGSLSGGWEATALHRLLNGENDQIVLPEYGSEANITIARK